MGCPKVANPVVVKLKVPSTGRHEQNVVSRIVAFLWPLKNARGNDIRVPESPPGKTGRRESISPQATSLYSRLTVRNENGPAHCEGTISRAEGISIFETYGLGK